MSDISSLLKDVIREVPDFPIPGILFKDISPIFLDPKLIELSAQSLAEAWKGQRIDKVIGIDSRGFLLGPRMATLLDAGFVMVRKKGKLPPETVQVSYELEYGNATLESIVESIQPGERVIIHDDLLATGGTAAAAAQLAVQTGGEVAGFSFIVSLSYLLGSNKLTPYSGNIHALIDFDK
ncbi:adenine phosphoribosyltransferase [Pontibacter sp. G13]|uniref:adenine phosphoribosyltransferase n=1 Tax=Pontibacter sp. G13 TaxID=3074898 RepID=UPI00288C25D7|nr:adenine phosphoribosyltransferase [Pontibacter sp. G13]WNJ18563.1 adenine phosphoribosyltransferase [Pontibacter sp. G13]